MPTDPLFLGGSLPDGGCYEFVVAGLAGRGRRAGGATSGIEDGEVGLADGLSTSVDTNECVVVGGGAKVDEGARGIRATGEDVVVELSGRAW